MKTVACTELKNRLGACLKIVKAGETIEVTDRGKVIARILPVAPGGQEARLRLMSLLAAKGHVRLGNGRLDLGHRPAKMRPGKTAAEMISEDRR